MNKDIISELRELNEKYQQRINEIISQNDPESYSRFEPEVLEDVIRDLKQIIMNEVERCL